jgi:hypothetical protein
MMFFRRLLAVFMTVLLLWSSAGAAIYQHVCRSSGLVEASFSEIIPCETAISKHQPERSCCENPYASDVAKDSFSDQGCCDYDQHFQKISTESTLTSSLLEHIANSYFAICLPVLLLTWDVDALSVDSFAFHTSDPIPLLQRVDSHALLQTFRC